MESKKCTKCGEVKPLDEFYKQKRGGFGRMGRCISCVSKYKATKYIESVGGKLTRKLINDIKEDHGDWLEVDVSTKSHQNSIMKIDKTDYEMIKSNPHYGRLYAVKMGRNNVYIHLRDISGDKANPLSIHRVLHPEWSCIDHINGDGTDNRRSNLRDGSGGVNEWNRHKQKNNTSGYTGVCRSGQRWKAEIRYKGKKVYLGLFDTPEEASEVYQTAKRKRDSSTPIVNNPLGVLNPDYNHYLYQITCDKTDMIYIGRHSGGDDDLLNDGYTGSGTRLNEDQTKYGMIHFHKTILTACKSYDELVKLEKETVNQEFVDRKDTYNQQVGG